MNLISKITLITVLSFYLIFGLNYSKKQGFWHDEMYTVTFLKGVSIYTFEGSVWGELDSVYDVKHFKTLLAIDKFYTNFSTQILHEGHPPLYFILLKLWSYAFGVSEVALRSFSLTCGLLSILVLFSLFKRVSKQNYTAWYVLIMLVFNPFLFYFFTEARMYALAFLLATLSFRFWLDYQKERKLKSKTFLYFCLSSVCLLYTHYYGLFFLSTLAFIELLNNRLKYSILGYVIVFVCFLPWGFVIRKQLSFHEVHWTDGAITFSESIIGYLDGITNLLISPMSSPFLYETVILIVLLSIMIVYLFIKERKFALVLLSAFFIYGLQIFGFDQVVGHHTILVPRYYIFSLIFIYWGIYKLIDGQYKLTSAVFTLTYLILSSSVIVQLYELKRAPKQMFRELAFFLDRQVDPKSRILVFEPKGALEAGVAYYLSNNFKIMSADNEPKKTETSAVYIDEMLGLEYCENKYHKEQKAKLELIPFAGVFLYK